MVRRRVVRADDDNSEGSSLLGAKIARILVFGRSVRIGTMMQSYASAAKPRGSGPILHRGLEAMEGTSGPIGTVERRYMKARRDFEKLMWDRASRPEESHPRALPDPCMNLSIHTAPDVRPFPRHSCQ